MAKSKDDIQIEMNKLRARIEHLEKIEAAARKVAMVYDDFSMPVDCPACGPDEPDEYNEARSELYSLLRESMTAESEAR